MMKRKRLKAIKRDTRARRLLTFLQKTGLFRWEPPATKYESALNIMTHGIGMGLAIAAVCVLECFAVVYGGAWAIVSCAIFGATMFILYFGSTMCHLMIGQKYDSFFEIWDSIAIYALIAGTYTPFLLVNLRGTLGWAVFGILWAIVALGACMKIASPNRQPKWIVLLYLLMGWTIAFILPASLEHIPPRALWFILSGGLAYSVGIIFYLWRRLKFSHALWHLFVIGGSVCFFFAILYGCILDYAA